MLLLIILVLALGAAAADFFRLCRLRRRGASASRLRLFAAWALLTDLLPLCVAVSGVLVRDNTPAYMWFAMWAFWLWLATVLPRLVFYLFDLVRRPRTGLILGVCVALLMIWGATTGRTRLDVNRVEVRSCRIPAGFDGYRIAQLSDIHLGSVVRPERELQRIVDSVNALRPDLVVFAGDLVNIRYTELDSTAMRILGGFRAPVVSVTGNHDVGVYVKDTAALPAAENLSRVIRRQHAMGWRVLQDTTLYLSSKGDTITLSGISFDPDLRKRRHDKELPPVNPAAWRGIPDSLYNITVVHLPQLWPQITAAGYGDLTLAGHVHAMQLKVHLLGRAWSPARLLYKRWSGRYDEAGSTLYINDGTGCVAYPMRLGAWPEITLFTLRHDPSCE